MTDKDGGPAFVPENDALRRKALPPGLSLRDWFAGQALAGFAAVAAKGPSVTAQDCSRHAYGFADAMLKARTAERDIYKHDCRAEKAEAELVGWKEHTEGWEKSCEKAEAERDALQARVDEYRQYIEMLLEDLKQYYSTPYELIEEISAALEPKP